ncbi:MAG: hypothetical protein ACTSV1_10380 [Alphaproteobacteria bacterium]
MLMLLLAALALPMPAAATRVCTSSPTPVRINIKRDIGKVVFKLGYGRADLKRLHRRNIKGRAADNLNPLGLTLTDFRFNIKTTVRLQPLAGGRHCATPESFDLNIGYSDFIIYIDRRYKRGSCEYRAIREHENTHVSLYRAYLARHMPELRRQAEATARRIKPTHVNRPDAGATYIQNQMQSRIKPIIDRIGREADAANAKIDTPRSYRDVQLLCDNW